MIGIKDAWLIQIEVTNACFLECTNCTRFVGHHKKPYFMDLPTIERAINSLIDFPGGIGIMGGEPTMHPQFDKICKLMQKKVPLERRFLWTAGYRWKEYRGIIRKTFAENVYYNDHKEEVQKHQPILLAIRDVLSDKKYMDELINNCWVQKMWSPSINPKGGFFCEVAAAMDILFDGPGGYPIEKKWWDRGPDEFRDQVKRYCYNCGAALPYPPVLNKENKDYVSISNYQRLQALRTPRFLRGHLKLVEEKYSTEQIKEFAKNWKPWEYLGGEPRKSYYFMYGPFWGFIVKMQKKIRKHQRKRRMRKR